MMQCIVTFFFKRTKIRANSCPGETYPYVFKFTFTSIVIVNLNTDLCLNKKTPKTWQMSALVSTLHGYYIIDVIDIIDVKDVIDVKDSR